MRITFFYYTVCVGSMYIRNRVLVALEKIGGGKEDIETQIRTEILPDILTNDLQYLPARMEFHSREAQYCGMTIPHYIITMI